MTTDPNPAPLCAQSPYSETLRMLRNASADEQFEIRVEGSPSDFFAALHDEDRQAYEHAPLDTEDQLFVIHRRANLRARSVAEFLIWDHDRLDRLLDEVNQNIAEGDWDRACTRIRQFRTGLFHHADQEDNVLWTAIGELSDEHYDLIQTMKDDHREFKDWVNEMVNAVEAHSRTEFENANANLLGVMVEHNMKEENVLYPFLDRRLDDSTRGQLIRRFMGS